MLSMLSLFGHKDPSEWISQAMVLAKQGLDVDPDYYWAHSALSLAYLMNRDYENAFVAADRAVSLQPNDADAHAYRGMNLFMAGRYAPAYTAIDEARHHSPEFVNAPYLNLKGMAACIEGDYEAAKEAFELNIARQGPVGPPVLAFLMTIYRHMGDEVQAARAADRLNTEFPGFRIGNWNFFRTIKNEADRHRILNDMEAAGVPV